MPPSLAVTFAVCEALTEETAAVNEALAEPAGTVTEAGTATALLLLARLTTSPPLGAAPLNEAAQATAPAPVKLDELHEIALRATVPVPFRLTVAVLPVEEVLSIVTVPVIAPPALGSNSTLRVTPVPGATVTGNRSPEIENPFPLTVAEEMVSGPVPVDFSATDWLTTVLAGTLRKLMAVLPSVRVGTAAFNCNSNDSETPPAAAVRVAV